MIRLYDYFRSSAAYRVRIALNLKGLNYESIPVNLREGEQGGPDYVAVNAQGLVPTLETGSTRLTQSLAICEYLDEAWPQTPLLPEDLGERARVRALAEIVACDIHPLNNLRVLKYLAGTFSVSEADKTRWYHHWIHEGFRAVETMLNDGESPGTYCHGESVTLADVCLVPQVYNAIRFGVDLDGYPAVRRVHEACERIPAFERARPENQPDAF